MHKSNVNDCIVNYDIQDFPNDFAALLEGSPASPVGSCRGVNLVNIAFGDYSGGVAGHEATEQIIRKGIEAIHDKVDV